MSTRNLGFALGYFDKTAKARRGSDMGVLVDHLQKVAEHVASGENVDILSRPNLVGFKGGYKVAAGEHLAFGATQTFAAPAAGSGESFGVRVAFIADAVANTIELVGGAAGDSTVRLVRTGASDWDLFVGDTVATGTTTNSSLGAIVAGDVVVVDFDVEDRELGTGNINYRIENLTQNTYVEGFIDNNDEFVGVASFSHVGRTNGVDNVGEVTFLEVEVFVAGAVVLGYEFSAEYKTAAGAYQAKVGFDTATATNTVATAETTAAVANEVAKFSV